MTTSWSEKKNGSKFGPFKCGAVKKKSGCAVIARRYKTAEKKSIKLNARHTEMNATLMINVEQDYITCERILT